MTAASRRVCGDGLLHRRRSCRSTTACSTTRRCCAQLLLLAARADLAEPLLPRWPGTSGGITTNGLWGYGVFDYPIILDLLDAAGVTLEDLQPRLGQRARTATPTTCPCSGRSTPTTTRTRGSKGGVPQRLRARAGCPQVSFIIPSYARGWDEHPPADVSVGMGIQEELHHARCASRRRGTARRTSSPTTSTAATSTTSRRRSSTRSGSASASRRGSISPCAKPRPPSSRPPYDLASILKFIERAARPADARLRQPPVRRRARPIGGNYQARPRRRRRRPRDDAIGDIGDLLDVLRRSDAEPTRTVAATR